MCRTGCQTFRILFLVHTEKSEGGALRFQSALLRECVGGTHVITLGAALGKGSVHYLVVNETLLCLCCFRYPSAHGLCSNVFAKRFGIVNGARALHEPRGKSVAARGVSWSLFCAGVGGAPRPRSFHIDGGQVSEHCR